MSALFDLPGDTLPARRPSNRGNLLDDLNPQQRDAVTHTGSPLLVVAGAGSGKTRVLTRRIAYLLAERHVHPGQIMAITFTNKAAAEMKERVTDLVGPRARVMWVSTFHSMCVRLLRREAKTLGMGSNFSVYDADDTRRLITLVARDLDLDPKRYAARALAVHVSNLKNELIDVESAAAAATNDIERRTAEVYASYQQRLSLANAMDFDDLIMRTVELLRAFPDTAEHYRRRFRHVLVDEYQDTNHAQYVLVRELVSGGASLFGSRTDPAGSGGPTEPDPDEHFLEDTGLGVGPVEHRHLARRGLARVGEPVHLLGHERGLVVLVVGHVADDRRTRPRVRPQVLRLAALVHRDHRVGRGQDVLGGAVILLQQDDLRVRVVLLELLDVADGGAAESVDGLVRVADHA